MRELRRLTLLAALLAACADTGANNQPDGGPPEEPDAAEVVFACIITQDCPIGYTCVGGLCVRNEQVLASGGCFSNADCPTGSTCYPFTGECFPRPDAGEAVTDTPDSGPPPVCIDGQLRSCGDSKLGECRFGQEECIGGQWSGQCVGAVVPVLKEACDDKDDDCDGLVDEDYTKAIDTRNCGECGHICTYANATPICESSDCRMGDCDSDWWDLNQLDRDGCEYLCHKTGDDEVCDGEDNDCDGAFDEDFVGLSESCGTGACSRTVPVCDSGVPRACVPGPTSPEQCNNIDDDCDDSTDEVADIGSTTCGRGPCQRTVQNCVNGAVQSCVPGTPGTEICDGNDNNCDGATDEIYAGVTERCGFGPCFNEVAVCQDGASQTCAPLPNDESSDTCNDNIDNDCDGPVDEGCGCPLGNVRVCYTGAPGTEGKGVCRAGNQTCVADGGGGPNDYEACSDQVLPTGEICDGYDNDCDTATDENLGTLSCGQSLCARTVPACLSGSPNTCTPGTPVDEGDGYPAQCNALDDDCDNVADDGYSAATCGTGVCKRTVQTCVGGVFYTCAPGPQTYASESALIPASCNSLDDDCDGLTDEGFGVTCGSGVCRRTVQTCVSGVYSACTPDLSKQVTEICDGLDNDCDGLADEDFADDDRDGFGECAGDCDDNNGTTYPGAPEQCNGRDDDCDGLTDETFDQDGDRWSVCVLDPLLKDCNDLNPAINPGATEICGNSVDEDCDGYAQLCPSSCLRDDDGDGYGGTNGGSAANCPDCNDSYASVHPGAPEICDGLDNDCNKFTVENCAVDERCFPVGYPDQCEPGLLCAYNISKGYNTCTSLCNFSPLGLGLNDGCAPNQSCIYMFFPADNLHACGVPAIVGAKLAGETTTAANQCRSTMTCPNEATGQNCLDNGAFGKYCTDFCADDTYCTPNVAIAANRTYCRILSTFVGGGAQIYTARCEKVPSNFKPNGQVCSASATDSQSECRSGDIGCQGGICAQTCCSDDHCPAGYHCANTGPVLEYRPTGPPTGMETTAPVCKPNLATNGGRRAGDACQRNDQCLSEFCERSALSGDGVNGKCVEICCNDTSCSDSGGTTTCEEALISMPDGFRQRARLCVHRSDMFDVNGNQETLVRRAGAN